MPVLALASTTGARASTNTLAESVNCVLNTVKLNPSRSANLAVTPIVARNAKPTVALGFPAKSITEVDETENVMISGALVRHGGCVALALASASASPLTTTPIRCSPVPETHSDPNVAEVTANQFWRGPSCMSHCNNGVPTSIKSGSSFAMASRGTTSASVTTGGIRDTVQSRNGLMLSSEAPRRKWWRAGADIHWVVYTPRRWS